MSNPTVKIFLVKLYNSKGDDPNGEDQEEKYKETNE